jgi:GDP-D-mannose 3',5'-epimerase
MIAVLGGLGFIGANLVARLVADGHDVRAVDIDAPEWRRDAVAGAELRFADLTDEGSADRAIVGCDVVFHLAADMGGVGYFHSDADLGASMRNGRITLNVVEACQRAGVARLFYASSACAYPTEGQMVAGKPEVLGEDQIGHGTPDALYGAEKLHGLRICNRTDFARVGILHTIYGPLQEHEGRRMKFPAAVATKALAARATGCLELWGDGRQQRSYLHVDDAVERIMRVALDDSYAGPVNIGATGAVSCREVAELCLDLVGVDAEIVTNEAEPSGVLARDCDLTKWDAVYGEAPDMGLRAGFSSFIGWLEGLAP